MRRTLATLAVLAVTILVATQTAAATSHLATASSHTTDEDFTNATTLDNLTVTGTGTDAVVHFAKARFEESFEDQPADSGVPDGWESTGIAFSTIEVSTNTASDGSQSVHMAENNGGTPSRIRPTNQPYTDTTTEPVSWDVYGVSRRTTLRLDEGGSRLLLVGMRNGDLQYYNGAWNTISTAPDNNEWVSITIDQIDPATDTVRITWETASNSGSVSDVTAETAMSTGYDSAPIGVLNEGSGTAEAYYDNYRSGQRPETGIYVSQTHAASNVTQGWTNLELDNASADVTWLPDVDGDGTFGDGQTVSSSYSSTGNHTQDLSGVDAKQWRVNVTLHNNAGATTTELHDEGLLFDPVAPTADDSSATPDGTETNEENVDLSIDVSDSDFATSQGDTVTVDFILDGTVIDTQTVSQNGTVSTTATGLSDGTHNWHVELADDYGETSSSSTFSFDVNHYAPEFDNASATPSGGTTENTRDINFSIDATDRDFAESSGDTVTVEFYLDGSSVGTDTLTANDTANLSVSGLDGGNHSWYAVATDEYGNTSTSATFEFSTPGTLYVRDESNPTTLIQNSDVQIRFYFEDGDDLIVNRTAENGTVDMTGLPTDRPFTVDADANGYYPRRIFVESLIESQDIYLLNESKQAVEPTFELVDYTGRFPEENTVMLIQRGLENDSGTIDWRTVQGDFFGATGQFPAQLRYNERHRLVLINIGTDTRLVKGQYTPTTSDLQEVRVLSTEEIQLQNVETIATIGPNIRSLVGRNGTAITATIDAGDTTVDSWTVTARYEDENTTEVIYQDSGSGAVDLNPRLNLSGRGGGQVNVTIEYTLESGTTNSKTAIFTVRESYQNEYSLLSVLGSVPTLLPGQHVDQATSMLALVFTLIGTTVVASQVRPSTEGVGLIAVAFVTGFHAIGWLSRETMFIAAVAWLAIAGLRRGL